MHGVKRFSVLCLALIAWATAILTASPAANAQDPASPPQLLVLDVELAGDRGGPELALEHQARMTLAAARLRESLARTGLYRLVDSAPAQQTLDELKSRYLYLHDCNGCDLDLGRQLGADQVLVAWVNRVSALILSLTYEIHDVATGQIIARKSFGFRGDNDTSWVRAIDYMVRDLQESPVPSPGRELQQRAATASSSVFQQPDGAVGTLLDLANAPLHIESLRFARPVAVELDTHQ
jgi:hypothetical protein